MANNIIPNQALLNGLNPLAYMGVRPNSPALYLIQTRDPGTNDKSYDIGTWWLNNNSPYNLWRLANLNAGVATWILTSSGPSELASLTSNSGGAVFPAAGNINVVGDGVTIVGVGNPGTNTITFSTEGSGVVSGITGNSGGEVDPSAGNINIVGDGTTIEVVGNPATHTLTISALGSGTVEFLEGNTGGDVGPSAGVIHVVGDGTGITIAGNAGTHTLTASLAGGGIAAQSFPCNDGTATPNSAGVLNVFGASNIVTTGSGNTITITGNIYDYTNVTTTPYVVLSTDDYLSVDTTVARTIELPNAPAFTGTIFIITDRSGLAGTNNITVTTVGGSVTINGSTSFVMNTNFESISVIFGVSGYEVF